MAADAVWSLSWAFTVADQEGGHGSRLPVASKQPDSLHLQHFGPHKTTKVAIQDTFSGLVKIITKM